MTELMTSQVIDAASNPFNCVAVPSTSAACNLYFRYYSELNPNVINSPAAADNGYPRYRSAKTKLEGSTQNAGNFPGVNSTADACEPWYAVWTGVASPADAASFITYYSASSQILNLSEGGGPTGTALVMNADCSGTGSGSCFGPTGNAVSSDTTGTPGGILARVGGLSPVPVPRVTVQPDANTLSLAWNAATSVNTVNRKSGTNTACPGGSSFDDLTVTSAPSPIYGVRLYVHTLPFGAPFLTLPALEGSAVAAGGSPATTLLGILNNTDQARVGCAGAGRGADCPVSDLVPCSSVLGATCASDGMTFSSAAQAFTLTRATLNSILPPGEAIDNDTVAVFNTKVVFRGAVDDSHAGARGTTNGHTNPGLMSLFSANSTRVSFQGLVARIDFKPGRYENGNVKLNWNAVGEYLEFQLSRSLDNGVTFEPLATVDAVPGQENYSYVDPLRGRRSAGLTYRLIGMDSDGVPTQVFSKVETTIEPTPRSTPRRR
jgi:hypothetical protein